MKHQFYTIINLKEIEKGDWTEYAIINLLFFFLLINI